MLVLRDQETSHLRRPQPTSFSLGLMRLQHCCPSVGAKVQTQRAEGWQWAGRNTAQQLRKSTTHSTADGSACRHKKHVGKRLQKNKRRDALLITPSTLDRREAGSSQLPTTSELRAAPIKQSHIEFLWWERGWCSCLPQPAKNTSTRPSRTQLQKGKFRIPSVRQARY